MGAGGLGQTDHAAAMLTQRDGERQYPAILVSAGDVAEWLRQRPAKPCIRVQFPASPPGTGLSTFGSGALSFSPGRLLWSDQRLTEWRSDVTDSGTR